MKKLLASVVIIVGFTLYAAFSRATTSAESIAEQDIATGGSSSASNSTVESATSTSQSADAATPPATAVASSTTVTTSRATTATTAVAKTTASTTKPATSKAASTTTTAKAVASGAFKNGTYTGSSADAHYGVVQIQVVVKGGKLVTVNVLKHPSGREESVAINDMALPILTREAIKAQSSRIQAVSGATFTSHAFMQSLSSALQQAKA